VHGESGIPEGNYEFWHTLFQGIVRARRPIEIDMHAKGIDQKMIDVAMETSGRPSRLTLPCSHTPPGSRRAAKSGFLSV
jgi:hypothetical protein